MVFPCSSGSSCETYEGIGHGSFGLLFVASINGEKIVIEISIEYEQKKRGCPENSDLEKPVF